MYGALNGCRLSQHENTCLLLSTTRLYQHLLASIDDGNQRGRLHSLCSLINDHHIESAACIEF
jgi:hypothetical protein